MKLINSSISFSKDSLEIFWNGSIYWIVFLAAFILIFLFSKNKKIKVSLLGYSICFGALIFNPLFFIIMEKAFGSYPIAYFCRFFLGFPIFIIIGYAIVLVANKRKHIIKYLIIVIGIFLLIIMGNSFYTQDFVSKASNFEKVPSEVKQIEQIITSDWEMRDMYEQRENPLVAAPTLYTSYLRQIDNNIDIPYTRDTFYYPLLAQLLDSTTPDSEELFSEIQKYDCDYVVTYALNDINEIYNNNGYEEVGYSDNCIVFGKVN